MTHRTRSLLLLCVATLSLPHLLGASRPPGLGDVNDLRTWSYADYTRVVIELSRSVAHPSVERLASDRDAQLPERLYLDLEGIWVGRRYESGIEVGDGLLQGVRVGQNTLRRSRLVIDLERYGNHRLTILEEPFRVVVDIYTPDARRSEEIDGRGGHQRLSMGLRKVRKVVLDPGHGGEDPGAIGVGGLQEKNVNLRLALRLSEHLRLRGFEVALTRDSEQTLDLEERTAIAEAAGGDLFVSLHANAAPRRKARGVEIYYLESDHDRRSLEVAARENGISLSRVDSLQRTLARLRVAESSVHSRRLAGFVHEDVARGLSEDFREVPDLGIKRGAFYVLFLSSMPAILVEAGFVTNRHDARLLRSPEYLELLAERIAVGLDRYREMDVQLARLPETGRGP